jgi:minor histocompatibility antigen H13
MADTDPSPKAALMGKIFYELTIIAPFIPTYLHLICSALFPIFTGAHASLSRPTSAAKPAKRKLRHGERQEQTQKMEGLSPSDALLYPLFTGCMLAGLYFLIKWLKSPEILNLILNAYLSLFGVFSISKLLSDGMTTIRSYAFPDKYIDQGLVWRLNDAGDTFEPMRMGPVPLSATPPGRTSPLPGVLSRISLPRGLNHGLWTVRRLPSLHLATLKARLGGLGSIRLRITAQEVLSSLLALSAVVYFNLVDRPWYLTNLLGFSFSYSALQLMSPTTFWTGTLVLTALFFYDIYFVFFTPMMITVATKLDVPVKLLFPRPSEPGKDGAAKQSLAMLGLGDIVLPGIMIGLALRFDLYAYYSKMQRRRELDSSSSTACGEDTSDKEKRTGTGPTQSPPTALVYGKDGIGKARYVSATGNWGDRFWLGAAKYAADGSCFPKPYFYASIVGYVLGMLTTVGVMHVFKHGQPALLYLVPGVLLSLWGTALFRGELKMMWEYTEVDEEEEKRKEETDKSKATTDEGKDNVVAKDEEKSKHESENGQDKKASSFSFSLARADTDSDVETDLKLGGTSKKGLKRVSRGPIGPVGEGDEEDDSGSESGSGSPSSADFVVSAKRDQEEPGLKKRRIA